jgi:hypothetical protein
VQRRDRPHELGGPSQRGEEEVRGLLADEHVCGVRVAADDERHIDASATRRPSILRTRSSGSTTASSSMPILHVPTGCQ